MRNHHAAVTRRLSDPDFQGALVTRCLALTPGMGALLAISLIHDAYVWMNPIKPRYFFVDGKNPPRPAVALDSPIVDDTELLEWTVKAVLAPYNVDYFNYPVELNTASRRFTVKGWNTFANSYIAQGNFDELKRARLLCHAQSQRAAVIHQTSYSQGALAGLELRSHRYIILVTLKELPSDTLGPDERTADGVIYRHINIVIEPEDPSKVSRTLARAAR